MHNNQPSEGNENMNVPAELANTVEMLQAGIYADGRGRKTLSPDLAKTFGISSGFQPYDLSPLAYILTPTFSPFRNRTPRNQRQGKNYEFKAVTSVDTANASAVAVQGTLANAITTGFADVTVSFEAYGLSSDPVTLEQQYAGEGRDPGAFSVDSRALAIANLLKALMIQEEKLMWGGLGASSQITSSGGDSWTFSGLVGNAATPTLASGTGGSLTGTVYVKITQKTWMGESTASSAANIAFGTTTGNSITVTPSAVANSPFTGYNVYASTNNTNYYLQGSTNGANFVLKSVGTGGVAPPTVDTTGSTNAFNGVWSYLFAGGSGASTYALNGTLTGMTPFNTVLENLWTNAYGDPDDLWMHAHDIDTLSNVLVGSGGPYYLTYDDKAQKDVVANARISRILNNVTQKIIPINVHAYFPQGQAVFTSSQVPAWYVGANIPGVWAQELTMDYTEIDYPPISTQPTWLSEIRCYGGLSCYVPQVNGIVTGIQSASGVNP